MWESSEVELCRSAAQKSKVGNLMFKFSDRNVDFIQAAFMMGSIPIPFTLVADARSPLRMYGWRT